jgi:broad specificity phosphatase PhoE
MKPAAAGIHFPAIEKSESMERQIHFVRHGLRVDFEDPGWRDTAANPNDTPLSAKGLRQSEDVAQALEGQGIVHIFSSPFLRTLETAHPLAERLGVPLLREPGFSEWLNPAWFQTAPRWMSAEEAAARFSRIDPGHEPLLEPSFPEETESPGVYNRVGMALERLAERFPEGNVAVFAHGSPLGQGIARLLGTLEGIDLHMGAITTIAVSDQGIRLVGSGTSHLRDFDSILRFH